MKSKETLKHYPVNRVMHQTDLMAHYFALNHTMPYVNRHDMTHAKHDAGHFHKTPLQMPVPPMQFFRQKEILSALRRFWIL